MNRQAYAHFSQIKSSSSKNSNEQKLLHAILTENLDRLNSILKTVQDDDNHQIQWSDRVKHRHGESNLPLPSYAAQTGNIAIINALLNAGAKFDFNGSIRSEDTPIYQAFFSGTKELTQLDAVKALVAHKVSLKPLQKNQTKGSLSFLNKIHKFNPDAAKRKEVIQFLIEEIKPNLNYFELPNDFSFALKNGSGEIAAHIVNLLPFADLAKSLLAEARRQDSELDLSIFRSAFENNDVAAVELLQSFGEMPADSDLEFIPTGAKKIRQLFKIADRQDLVHSGTASSSSSQQNYLADMTESKSMDMSFTQTEIDSDVDANSEATEFLESFNDGVVSFVALRREATLVPREHEEKVSSGSSQSQKRVQISHSSKEMDGSAAKKNKIEQKKDTATKTKKEEIKLRLKNVRSTLSERSRAYPESIKRLVHEALQNEFGVTEISRYSTISISTIKLWRAARASEISHANTSPKAASSSSAQIDLTDSTE